MSTRISVHETLILAMRCFLWLSVRGLVCFFFFSLWLVVDVIVSFLCIKFYFRREGYNHIINTLFSLSQGSDLWKDRDRFKSFAQASLDLCKVYMEISSSTGSRRELLAAEMHLKNIIKQVRCLYFDVWEHLFIYIYMCVCVNLIITMVDGKFEPRMSPLETSRGANWITRL